MNQEELLERVNMALGKDYTHKSYLETIEDLCTKVEDQQTELDLLENAVIKALKDELLKAHEQIKRQDQEYATLYESIAEDDAIVQQLQQEIKQYQLQESLLIERLKKAQQNSRFIKYIEMAEENLRLYEENARLKKEVPV